jgi:hypothetical protein
VRDLSSDARHLSIKIAFKIVLLEFVANKDGTKIHLLHNFVQRLVTLFCCRAWTTAVVAKLYN